MPRAPGTVTVELIGGPLDGTVEEVPVPLGTIAPGKDTFRLRYPWHWQGERPVIGVSGLVEQRPVFFRGEVTYETTDPRPAGKVIDLHFAGYRVLGYDVRGGGTP